MEREEKNLMERKDVGPVLMEMGKMVKPFVYGLWRDKKIKGVLKYIYKIRKFIPLGGYFLFIPIIF